MFLYSQRLRQLGSGSQRLPGGCAKKEILLPRLESCFLNCCLLSGGLGPASDLQHGGPAGFRNPPGTPELSTLQGPG